MMTGSLHVHRASWIALAAVSLALACGDDAPTHPPAGAGASGGSGGSGAGGGAGGSGGSAGAGGAGGSGGVTSAGDCGPALWAERFGGSSPEMQLAEERARAVALDVDGSALVTGVYAGDADFGGGPLVAGQDNQSLFLLKLDPDGQHVWSKGFGDPGDGVIYAPFARGSAVAVAPGGDVIVAGAFAGVIDFGGGLLYSADPLAMPPDVPGGCLLTCAPDIVIARYGPDGAFQWAQRFGDVDGDAATDVAVDGAGNVWVVGVFRGTVDFGGGPLAAAGAAGARDAFVLALAPDGTHLFSQRFGGDQDDQALAVALDPGGDVLVAGSFAGQVSFGGGMLTSPGDFDGFVMKLDGSGNPLWARGLGATNYSEIEALAVDGLGRTVAAGLFRGTMPVDSDPVTSAYNDAFVLSFGLDGTVQWGRSFGGVQNDEALGVALDAGGHAHVTGSVSADSVDFGGGPLSGGTSDDTFVVELDGTGAHVCSRRLPGEDVTGSSAGLAIAVDPAGQAVVGGSFSYSVDFGAAELTSTGGLDIFVMKLGQ